MFVWRDFVAQFKQTILGPLWFFIQPLLSTIVFTVIFGNSAVILVPVLIVIMAGLGLGFGIIISSLTTKYRDLVQLIGFGVQLLMYITPVVIPLSFLSEKYR